MHGEVRCPLCKAGLTTGVVKCAACGEWIDGRWRVSDAAKICLALIAASTVGLFALTTTWARAMGEMYAEFGGVLPTLTRLALHPAWPVAWLAGVVGVVVASFVSTTRARRRTTLLAIALFVAITGCVVTWWAVGLPVHDLAGHIPVQ